MAKITGSDLPARAPQSEEEEEQYAAGNFPVLNGNKAPRVFQEEDLRGISNFDEAFAAAQEQFGDVVDASTAIGTGFTVLDTEAKNSLCGVPFLILEMAFNHGDLGEFVSFVAVTEDNRRVIVNDGSTGIYEQLSNYVARTNREGGLLVKGGLRRSDYPANDTRPAGTTYYLNV